MMSESMYCPKCNSYLMAGDGKCHDCTCGWTQSRDSENEEYWSAEVSALKDNVSQLQSRNRQLSDMASGLEAERDELRAQVEAMRELLRKIAPHFAAPPGLGYLYAEIDAALQANP